MLSYSKFKSAGRRQTTMPASLQKKEYSSASTIQTKLTVGKPNDKYEQEADRVADQVVNNTPAQRPAIQKKCADCEKEETAQMKPILQKVEEEEVQTKPLPNIMKMKEEEEAQPKLQLMEEEEAQPKLQKKETNESETIGLRGDQIQKVEEEEIQTKPENKSNGNQASAQIESNIKATQGQGSPMDKSTQSFMESGIGADFSNVRIHNDSKAHQLSAKLNAQAFAVGNNVFFNKGKYNPQSQSGKHLLAHELTHTVQQGASGNTLQRKKHTDKASNPCPAKPIDDARVIGHIKTALNSANVKGKTLTPGQIADNGWKILKYKRDLKKNHCDWDLAAAEHYMLTRSFSSHGNWIIPGSPKSPPGGVMAIVGAYNLIKGTAGMFKQGTGPHSPITQKALLWAQQGTIDGTYYPNKYLTKTCQLYFYHGKIGKKTFKKSDNIIVIESKNLSAPSNASINMGIPRIKVQPVTKAGYRVFGKQPLRWVKTSKLSCYN